MTDERRNWGYSNGDLWADPGPPWVASIHSELIRLPARPQRPLTEADTFVADLTTSSGTRYLISWDAETSTGTLERTPTLHPDHPMSGSLRLDGQTMPLVGFGRIALGEETTFVVLVREGAITTRSANVVVELDSVVSA